MAEQNYIGIVMGLDVTSLKAGLSEANKQIQLANSDFKAASSNMDDWTKSTEGLSAKVKQLTTVLGLQKSKLNGLQAEYDNLVASGKENTEEARRLKVQLNNQQAVVNKTEKELKNYSETLKAAEAGTIDLENVTLKAGKAVDKLGDEAKDSSSKMDSIKGIAGGVGKGLLGIAGAAAGAVAGFLALGESTRETRNNIAKLETGFKTAGLTTEQATNTYSKLYGVLGDTGKATEATAMIGQMAKSEEDLANWTNIATGVYATFGDSLPIENLAEASLETSKTGKITGGLADALNWAGQSEEEFQAKLDACTSEQERQKLITDTLTASYGDASAQFKETNKDIIAAQEADAALSLAMAELGAVAEPVMTMIKTLSTEVLGAMMPFVQLLGSGLTDALSGVDGGAEKMAEGISGIVGVLLDTVAQMLPKLVELVVQLLPTLLTTVIQSLSQILDTISSMLPTLIPILIDAILMMVSTIIDNLDLLINAGIKLIESLADGLIDALPKLLDKLPILFQKLMFALENNYPKLIKAGMDLIIKLAAGLIKAIPQLLAAVPQIITSLLGAWSNIGKEMGKIGKDVIEGLWSGIKDKTKWIKDKIKGFVGDVKKFFTDFFGISSPSKLMRDTVGLFIGEGIGEGLIKSLPFVKKDIDEFSNRMTSNLSNIKGGLSLNTTSGLLAANNGAASSSVNNFTQIINAPKQPSLEDLYRRTGNLLDLKGGIV